MIDLFEHITALKEIGGPAVLATVVDIEGGSRSRIGARMFVLPDGRRLGSLTVGGCVDGRAADEAVVVLEDGRPRDIHIRLGDDEPDFGMSCAGIVRVFIERVDADAPQLRALDEVRASLSADRPALAVLPLGVGGVPSCITPESEAPPWPDVEGAAREAVLEDCAALIPETDDHPELFLQPFRPPPQLVIIGTGPVAEPLVHLAARVGYRTIIVDGKEIDGYEEATERRTGIPSKICAELDLDERTAVVITAHDYKYEVPVLREVLGRAVGYVGFVASTRRGGAVLDFLETTGIDPAQLETVRVPVGLDIGAETPAEIAVSVLGEILAVRAGRPGGSLRVAPTQEKQVAR